MHHGKDQIPDEILKQFTDSIDQDGRKLLQRMLEPMQTINKEPLGATGRHPDGKLTPTDKGEIRFAVAHKPDNVIIDFGTQVAWIAMSPDQADELAKTLHKHAKKARRGE
jgi:hypothetical protein